MWSDGYEPHAPPCVFSWIGTLCPGWDSKPPVHRENCGCPGTPNFQHRENCECSAPYVFKHKLPAPEADVPIRVSRTVFDRLAGLKTFPGQPLNNIIEGLLGGSD